MPEGDSCVCYGDITDGVCTPCASGLYFTGLECLDCSLATPHCLTCNNETGKCDTCSAPYLLSSDFTCECPTGQTDTGSSCVSLSSCPAGQYRNIDGNCYNCGTGCSSCDALTGNCNQCSSGKVLDLSNISNCYTTSAYTPIGPIASPSAVVSSPYSTGVRLVPPFDSSVREIDWRDWYIVNPIQD